MKKNENNFVLMVLQKFSHLRFNHIYRDAVLAAHPTLTSWPTQSVTCFDLMFLESQAII